MAHDRSPQGNLRWPGNGPELSRAAAGGVGWSEMLGRPFSIAPFAYLTCLSRDEVLRLRHRPIIVVEDQGEFTVPFALLAHFD